MTDLQARFYRKKNWDNVPHQIDAPSGVGYGEGYIPSPANKGLCGSVMKSQQSPGQTATKNAFWHILKAKVAKHLQLPALVRTKKNDQLNVKNLEKSTELSEILKLRSVLKVHLSV